MTTYAEQHRPLACATVVSLALHALALTLVAAAWKELRPQAYSSPIAVVVRMVEPEPTPAKVAKHKAAKRAPKIPLAPPPPPPADAASVAQFRQQFIGSAARYLDYPREALANEAEGKVVVSVSFAAGRAAAEVSVKMSSGHYLLDAQALDMFRRAAAELALPGALRGQEFAFEVPVVYALKR